VPFVRINGIGLDIDGHYVVNYETFEYTEQLPGMHIHFFFNTTPVEQAGKPGTGLWMIYGGPKPFSGFIQNDRPEFATQLCALVANPNHSVQPSSGNCFNRRMSSYAPLEDTSCRLGLDPPSCICTGTGPGAWCWSLSDENWWFIANLKTWSESCWLARQGTSESGPRQLD
jgi:hypothetical protein